MDDLLALYQEIIVDHNKSPRNYREMELPSGVISARNPLCGDELTVFFKRDEERHLEDISFLGESCAICRASASLMTVRLRGGSEDDVLTDFERVKKLLQGDSGEISDLDVLGDLMALSGVRRFPARIKCALLAWQALASGLEGMEKVSTE